MIYAAVQITEYMPGSAIRTFHTVAIVKRLQSNSNKPETLEIVRKWERVTNYEIHAYLKQAEDLVSRMNNGYSTPNVEVQQ